MDKMRVRFLVSAIVSGLFAMQAEAASAQVPASDAAESQAALPAAQPAPPEPVYVPAPVAPTLINTIQVGQFYDGTSRSGGKLMIIGGALFGVTYFATILGAAIVSDVCQADSTLGCQAARWPIYLPVVGPFIQMGYLNGNGANTGRVVLGFDGAMQVAGLAMFIAGAVKWGRSASHAQYAQRVQLVPYSAATGTGLLALGRF